MGEPLNTNHQNERRISFGDKRSSVTRSVLERHTMVALDMAGDPAIPTLN
jgi:hypothetical protein